MMVADFRSRSVSKEFKEKFKQSNITPIFSSPYHHQANSLAEKSVGTWKSLWKKALATKQCPHAAIWMHRITPIDSHLPYELPYGRKPTSLLPSGKSALQSKHPDSDKHLESNVQRQIQQAKFYNKTADHDKQAFEKADPVYIWNSLEHIWEPGVIFDRPNPDREPRTYMVEKNQKLYQNNKGTFST